MSAIVVDVGARLVRREGIDVHLAPKAFELLLILVRNQPNAVPHEQLHAALGPASMSPRRAWPHWSRSFARHSTIALAMAA